MVDAIKGRHNVEEDQQRCFAHRPPSTGHRTGRPMPSLYHGAAWSPTEMDPGHPFRPGQEKAPPLSLAFISALMELIKESWNQLSTSLPVARRTENLYRTHGDDTNFLIKHPAPNSIIVQSSSSKSSGKSHVTPTNREGRKLYVLGRKIHSFITFLLRVVNYQAAMRAYKR